ncbi:stage II sporulation protein P [Sutcliffiella sp. NC1]|uniref:stage II sporulation protein P n=1 Tax=Sutcliffiella sp. NC1 TaxID=3004096 RepID=UPI0022DD32EB|nr:stage II sporulation protein P [Sutcliffiella sp. NC1]WBL13880.1 stage II sporulation protein P [Sutcliffiella sp. NC1]
MKGYRSSSFVVTINGTSIKKTIVAIIAGFMLIFAVSGLLTSLKPEYRVTFSAINEFSKRFSGESLLFIFGYENAYFTQGISEGVKKPNYVSALFQLTTSLNLDDPRSLIRGEIPGFRQYDGEILIAGQGTNYTNLPFESPPPRDVMMAEREAAIINLEEEDSTGEGNTTPPANNTGDRKVVYIYNTHNTESFLPYLEGVTEADRAYHSQVNVTRLGERLKTELETRGVGAQFETKDIMEDLNKRGWVFGQAYNASRPVVKEAMASNRDLQYFIDIHRDSQGKDITTIDLNGEKYARVMFVIGKNNPNYEKNERLVAELHELFEEKYPGVSRGSFVPKGSVNGVYNQDLSENSILIEIGGVENTFEEMYRTVEAFADVFSEFYWQAEKVDGTPQGEGQ